MKPFGAQYGAIIGLHAVGGAEAVRVLIVPNLPTYGNLLKDGMGEEDPRRPEAERVLQVLFAVLASLREGRAPLANGDAGTVTDDLRTRLAAKVGDFLAGKISEVGNVQMAHDILGS